MQIHYKRIMLSKNIFFVNLVAKQNNLSLIPCFPFQVLKNYRNGTCADAPGRPLRSIRHLTGAGVDTLQFNAVKRRDFQLQRSRMPNFQFVTGVVFPANESKFARRNRYCESTSAER